MARNIRWRCSFKSLKGVSCVINIYDNDWSGGIVSVTGADDPFYYEEDNSDDILNEVIRYRTGYIRLVEQGVFGALKDIYPTSTFDRFVEVLYDGAVVFNGYIQSEEILEHIDRYIVEPGLGTRSGATGALLLAKQAWAEAR